MLHMPDRVRVLLSTIHMPWPWFRQTPNGDGKWGSLTFLLDDPDYEADWLVVYDEPPAGLTTRLPLNRRILFITEPPGMKTYDRSYLKQFGTVVSAFRPPGYRGRIVQRQPALPWHYGVDMRARDYANSAMGWSELAGEKEKSKDISVICSNKAILPHHRARLAFVERLKERLGDRVDIFGRGFNEIGDKAEAIAPYRYHIALENNVIDHFWTEKLADAWLGDSYPIFAGCSNAADYFDPSGFAEIDIRDPDRAIDRIEAVVASGAWHAHRDAIRENRRRVMNEHNVFAVIERVIAEDGSLPHGGERLPAPVRILPSYRKGMRAILRRIARFALNLPGRLVRRLIPEQTRLRWKLKVASRNPFLVVDFDDSLGARARSLGYHSQRGQDYFVDRELGRRAHGFFVDVGANHPTEINNTYYFERSGWNGLSFEPQEHLCALFKKQRRTPVLPYVLGPHEGEVEFATVESTDWEHALSGVSDVVELGVPALQNRPVRLSMKSMRRLDNVLLEHGITQVDFMSIDVEGFELEVLKGLDFQKVRVDVLIVENDRTPFGDETIRRYLRSKGYRHIARLSGDDVFRLRSQLSTDAGSKCTRSV
jgi:FkbM family methyltransferase